MKSTNIILLLTFYLLNTNTIMSLPTCPQCDTHEEGSSWSDDIICYKKWKDTIRCSPTYEEDGMGPCLEKYWKKCQTCESKYEQTKLKERDDSDSSKDHVDSISSTCIYKKCQISGNHEHLE